MKMLLGAIALAAAFTVADMAAGPWTGDNVAQAQTSSACIQNCTNVRRWPTAQCREYCRGKAKKKKR
jgi:hypothetical protein